MPRIGPVILSVAGDEFLDSCRILLILWTGATTSGDTARVVSRDDTGAEIWRGRTDSTQVYLGANFGPTGLHAPVGFKLNQISAGTVSVYLKEE